MNERWGACNLCVNIYFVFAIFIKNINMTENETEERLTHNASAAATITISELPGRPFSLTMEVPLFITILSVSLSGPVLSNILLYRTCVHSLNHTEAECHIFLSPDKTNTSNSLEQEVQEYTAFVSMAKSIMESVGPAIVSVFLGVWSDTYGRKPLVVWPLIGVAVSSIMTVVYAMLDQYGPWWYTLTAVPYSLTGGATALFTGAFTYVSDITTTGNRSLRMTILEGAVSLGSVIGAVASSYLIKAIGNVYLLLVVAALSVASYAFTDLFLRESLTGALKGGLSTLIDIRLVKEMLETCLKRRPNKKRAQILLLTIANCTTIFIMYGLMSLDYLYVREKLHWAVKEYSIFGAAKMIISLVGSIVGVTLVQKVFGLSDVTLIIVAFLSSLADYVTTAFAVQNWHMYLGASISVFRGLSAPLIRSLITKILPIEDIAKVFALMCALEAICPLFSPVLYSSLYAETIAAFPGAIYLLSAGITACCVVMIGFVQYYSWRYSERYQTLIEES